MEENKVSPVGKSVTVWLKDPTGHQCEIGRGYVEKMTAHVIYLRDQKTQKLIWVGWGPGIKMVEEK